MVPRGGFATKPTVTMNQQAMLDDDQAVLGLFDKYCELQFRFLENQENPLVGVLKPIASMYVSTKVRQLDSRIQIAAM